MFLETFLTAILVASNQTVYDGHGGFLLEFFQKLETEQHFELLIVYENFLMDNVLSGLEAQVVLLNSSANFNLTASHFNRDFVILYCIDKELEEMKFEHFVQSLGRQRDSRIIFAWSIQEPAILTDVRLVEHFKRCVKYYLPNVICIYADFWKSKRFYSFKQFPKLSPIYRYIDEKIFADPFTNLHGSPLRTFLDRVEPRSYTYEDATGTHVGGYTLKIVSTFAAKHNGTIKFIYPLNKTDVPYNIIVVLAKADELDIPMSLSSPVRNCNLEVYSNVVEQATWFPMIPLAPPTATYDIFLLIICSRLTVVLIILWLVYDCVLTFSAWNRISYGNSTFWTKIINLSPLLTSTFRGLLGQSITFLNESSMSLKLVYALLFLTGMLFGTTYNAYLQTFLTSPPKPKQINTFESLMAANIPLYITAYEFATLRDFTTKEFWNKYERSFTVVDSKLYQTRRKLLDTRSAFTITSSLWPVLDQRQSQLVRPRFHHPEQMYFTKSLHMCVPQHEHSIYRRPLNTLISQLKESGILHNWRVNSYIDMVIDGKINSTREWKDTDPRGLTTNDLYWIWWLYCIGVSLGLLAFLGELTFCKKYQTRISNEE